MHGACHARSGGFAVPAPMLSHWATLISPQRHLPRPLSRRATRTQPEASLRPDFNRLTTEPDFAYTSAIRHLRMVAALSESVQLAAGDGEHVHAQFGMMLTPKPAIQAPNANGSGIWRVRAGSGRLNANGSGIWRNRAGTTRVMRTAAPFGATRDVSELADRPVQDTKKRRPHWTPLQNP